ncbi:hypothetical protein AB1L88_25745 [Tautonia sp. JC769]|uniref:hypothetical protein n=1 Tax=Tautonia sp. JC769 TaxID=3232135 RepID=UPI00345A0192
MEKVRLNLVGIDGNAYSLLGAFAATAREQGWSDQEIEAVREEATSSNYDHLVRTLVGYTDPPDDDEMETAGFRL